MRCALIRLGLLLGLGFSWVGCTLVGDDLYPALDVVPPEVVETFPAQGWRQVPIRVRPVVWFSEPVEPGSIHLGNLALVSGDHVQRGRYRVEVDPDGRGRVTLEPLAPLLSGVLYELRVGGGVDDLAGNPLARPVSVTFRTLR